MRLRTWRRAALYTVIALLALASVGLTYLATRGFAYYDNGRWVQSNLLAIYAKSLIGYGTRAIEDRRLPPDWGSRLGYAARNFTLDLVGLDCSLPLSWEDIATGPGLTVMQPAGIDRTPVALYPPGIIVKPGEKAAATIRLVKEDTGTSAEVRTPYTTAYSVTLYRPRFSSVAYVIAVNPTQSDVPEPSAEGSGDGIDSGLRSQGSALDFALGLSRESFKEDGGARNVLVSPYSVTEAFSIACAGAVGDTRDTMARVLGLESSAPADIMWSRRSLHDVLKSLAPDIALLVANSVWMTDRTGITFRPEFVKTCSDIFGAETKTVDFSDPSTVGLINGWVNRKTNGKIPSIVNEVPADQIAALVNAVYMKARWQYPFNPQVTGKAQFILATGATVECDMMFGGARVEYLDGEGFQAVRLPYAGDKMDMYLFLPDEGTDLAAFVNGLTAAEWSHWMEELQPAQARIHLPRFKFEYSISLIQTLTDLGMGIAFDPVKADFSAMCEAPENVPVYIGSVEHKTFISVDEKGTEAAASTYIAVAGSGPQNPVDITFDRPFLFAVADSTDPNLVLFIGCVIQP